MHTKLPKRYTTLYASADERIEVDTICRRKEAGPCRRGLYNLGFDGERNMSCIAETAAVDRVLSTREEHTAAWNMASSVFSLLKPKLS